MLTEAQWLCLRPFLQACPGIYVGNETRCRIFVAARGWRARSGTPWRRWPAAYGKGIPVYRRWATGCARGVWPRRMAYLQAKPELSAGRRDSTVGRAPQKKIDIYQNPCKRRLILSIIKPPVRMKGARGKNMNEARSNRDKPHWGEREIGEAADNVLPLRNQIASELSETRLFVNSLYLERSKAGKRLQIAKLFQRGGVALPWCQIVPYDEISSETSSK